MKQKEKVELFLNWLMDNHDFNEYVNYFIFKFKIRENGYSALLKTLNETNYQDFVDILLDKDVNDPFGIELTSIQWKRYYESNDLLKTNVDFSKGDFICYEVINYGVKAKYVSLVKSCDNDFIEEYCSAILSSDDEELCGNVDYETEVCLTDESVKSVRKATDYEKDWLKSYILEMDNIDINTLI